MAKSSTSFKKGQKCPNPGGRPKVVKEVAELARQYGPQAIEKMIHLMQNAADERTQLAAAQALLDRGYGKPQQSMEVSGKADTPLTAVLNVSIGTPKTP